MASDGSDMLFDFFFFNTRITCCTSTKVQILTPEELHARASQQHEAASKCEGGRGEEAVAAEASRQPAGRHTAVAPCNNNGSDVLQMSMVMAMVTYLLYASDIYASLVDICP